MLCRRNLCSSIQPLERISKWATTMSPKEESLLRVDVQMLAISSTNFPMYDSLSFFTSVFCGFARIEPSIIFPFTLLANMVLYWEIRFV